MDINKQKIAQEITAIVQQATPERIADARAAAGVGTASGALFVGMKADELTQALQIVATIGGIAVSLATFVYVCLGIYQRIQRIRAGKAE